MLSTEEKAEIDKEIHKVAFRRSAGLEALMIVQHHRGYVSDEVIKDVAEYLQISPTELDGIATFYNLIYRRPVGKNVIRICNSITCWMLGYEDLKAILKEQLGVELGQTTEDNQFTLLPAQCLGCCDKSPALMIGGELHTNVTKASLIEIIRSYKQEKVKDGAPPHSAH